MPSPLTDRPATTPRTHGSTRDPELSDGLGQPRPVVPGSFRERVHSTAGLALAWRIGVFVVGLLFVLLGLALTVLPGPLTIPPVLVGLWVWSTEFDWARKVFAAFARQGRDAWRHAKQHPVSSAVITIGGLAAAALVFWAVGHYELVDKATSALGF